MQTPPSQLPTPPVADISPLPPAPTQAHLELPTVQELISSPFLPSDITDSIPGPCIHSVMLLLIKLMRAAAATSTPEDTHQAFLHLHIMPIAVLRRSFRGEPGWRTGTGQMYALRDRVRRATSGSEWPALWHEALQAHATRAEWHRRNPRPIRARPRVPRQMARAMRQAEDAQYGKAMRTLSQSSIAPLQDPATHTALRHMHPSPPEPVNPVPQEDLPPAPDVTEEEVRRAARAMNATSAAGPDRMSPRLLHLIVSSHVSPQAGITGLSSLTALVRRLARGNLPEQTIPLIAAACLIPVQPRPDKIRPIAIGQALRRLVTKVLLPAAIQDTRDDLSPQQVANGIPSAMDAIVHDTRMWTNRHQDDTDYILVSVDANNAFNCFSRQHMLNMLTTRTPSLARFINMIYARTLPRLITPSSPPQTIYSAEGSQQGDPASMLLFSLAIQPLIRKLSIECDLTYNRWYADDGTIIGRIPEVCKALKILSDDGPSHQFYVNPSKTRAYWPNMDASKLHTITSQFPVQTEHNGGIMLLGAPIGTPNYMKTQLQAKMDDCAAALARIEKVPDARIKFHLHRVTASVCRLQHIFRLVPPPVSEPLAQRFDKDQLRSYSLFNNVPISTSVGEQIHLPFRYGGHGFTPLAPLVQASYAASLIESAPIRANAPDAHPVVLYRRFARPFLHRFVDSLPERVNPQTDNSILRQPDELAQRPERTNKILFQAWSKAAAERYWEHGLWKLKPNPNDHEYPVVRRRARYQSLLAHGATDFLTAHPSTITKVPGNLWSVMLRRHLDIPVYDDSEALKCAHCERRMDAQGDHATSTCPRGFGRTHRHTSVVRTLGPHMFRMARKAYSYEVPLLVPNTALRPADILVQPGPPPPGEPPSLPTAYDVTVRSPYLRHVCKRAAAQVAGAAEAAHNDKIKSLQRALRSTSGITNNTPIAALNFKFVPLAFDTLGAPSAKTTSVIKDYAQQIAHRSSASYDTVKRRITQRISYAIWSTNATSIISRTPALRSDLAYPAQI